MVGLEKARFVVEFSVRVAPETNYRPQTFGGILQYTSRALAQFDDTRRVNKQREEIAACPFCDEHGFIEVPSADRAGHRTVRLCSHSQVESATGMREADASPNAQNALKKGLMPMNEKNDGESSPSSQRPKF